MTKEQALELLEKATAALRLSREEHALVLKALEVLKSSQDSAKTLSQK